MHPATRRQLLGVAGLLAVAAAGTLVFSPGDAVAHLEALSDHPLRFGAVLLGLYLVRSLFLWPVSLVSVLVGYLYDPMVAIPVCLVGAGISALPPYVVARHAPSDAGAFGSLARAGRETVGAVGAFRGTVAARITPIPGDAISYAAGLANVSVGAFFAGTVVGEIPWTLAAVAAGNSMETLTVGGFHPGLSFLLGLCGVAIILCWRPIYRLLHDGTAEAIRS